MRSRGPLTIVGKVKVAIVGQRGKSTGTVPR